jgi:hypothetical protein
LILEGCGGGGANRPTITTQPASQNVLVGQTATFSVTATGLGTLSYQWQKGGTAIQGATSASYTTGTTAISDSGSQFSVVVSGGAGVVTSNPASLTVSPFTDVLTWHNDNARTGLNLTEALLTTANVNSAGFGKITFFPTDNYVDAEPLYASNVAIPGQGTHNLLIVASENNSVYAFDPDSGATIWQVSVNQSGETPSEEPGCPTCPPIGINATPVIDRGEGPNGAIYLVASSTTSQNGTSITYQRLHAIDLALGTELFGGPVAIQAKYPGTGDNSDGTNVIFDPVMYRERSALLLQGGVVYTTWASHYDVRPYTGWIIGYSESTLAQASVLNVTPNGNEGAIWMSGAGPAADSSGNIYLLDANGIFDSTMNAQGFPAEGDYGNAFLKLSTANGLQVADYFEMNNQLEENDEDIDLGSGGAMLLPDQQDPAGNTVHMAVGAGKDANLYVVNRDSMGKLSENNAAIYQELPLALPGLVFSAPAYFNNMIYYGPWGAPIVGYPVANAKLSPATVAGGGAFAYPGATPSISANGTSNGIVWALETVANVCPGGGTGTLHAYDATNLQELYNSAQASGGRDQFVCGKFITPMIVNGKVFVGTPTGVAVFGLLP